jgi:uncharacterized membrane protein YdjX (TVP38/TMEM64 family)
VAVGAAGTQLLGGLVVLGWAYANAVWLGEGGLAVAGVLLLGGVVLCGLALVPTHVVSLVGGWSLGAAGGAGVAVLAATIGAPVGKWLAGRLAGDGLARAAQRSPRGAAVMRAIGGEGESESRWSWARAAMWVGLLRLSPAVPYGTTNVLAAVFGLGWWPLVLGTAAGLLPRAAAMAWVGSALGRLDEPAGPPVGVVVLGIVATGVLLVGLGWVAGRALRGVGQAG